MAPLTIDDLLPLEEYIRRRREFFESHRRYLDRCRLVRIGRGLTLIFENRRTLWFRIQEVVRLARLARRSELEQELDLYNRLLPGQNLLQAAWLIDMDAWATEQLPAWRELRGDYLRLVIGAAEFPAILVTPPANSPTPGSAHWVQFSIPAEHHFLLGALNLPARFVFDNGVIRQESAELREELRLSLLEDLEGTERSGETRTSLANIATS
ncbi:MAG: DUF3501 family protein [Gemmataceae bacterium]|nr:DUF3501 family protein [Gemmataceae bacterium]